MWTSIWSWLSSFWLEPEREREREREIQRILVQQWRPLPRPPPAEEYEWDVETLDESLQKLPCHDLHENNKALFTQLSGFHVPFSYEKQDVRDEVIITRGYGSIYDASYKRQFLLIGKDAPKFLDALVTSDIESLEEWKSVLTLMTNHNGGIIDDLLVSKQNEGTLRIVANTSKVLTEIQNHLKSFEGDVSFQIAEEKCYLTFQGPECAYFLNNTFKDVENLQWMQNKAFGDIFITRHPTTGDDGYSISCKDGISLMNSLNMSYYKPRMTFIGLEAKECLRIESGECLSGVDFDEYTTPVEADLTHLISERKRKFGGFPGSDRILNEIKTRPKKIRRGFISDEEWILKGDNVRSLKGEIIGTITSGSYSPCIKKCIAMGYVDNMNYRESDKLLFDNVKGKLHDLPFVKHGTARQVLEHSI